MPLSHPLCNEPSLRPLRPMEAARLFCRHAWKTRRFEITVFLAAIIVLGIGISSAAGLRPPWLAANPAASGPENIPAWLGNIQAVLGAFTLFVAVSVWVNELREDWEQELPCRMSVHFFHEGQPAVVCRHVWLAGADDLRAWGQQVGAQAAGDRFLDFTPDLTARPHELALTPDGAACRLYAVRFHLTKLPASLATAPGCCRYQNLIAPDRTLRTLPVASVAALSDVAAWSSSPD